MEKVRFPSPFGVRVLKFLESIPEPKMIEEVSVPFRGSCSEIQLHISLKVDPIQMVSVPFRGSCSEMPENVLTVAGLLPKFPSPFGVRVLKF